MRYALLFCAILLAQPAPAQPAASESSPRATPADVAAGARTFRSHCSPCHGLNAEGGRGPNLAAGRFYHGSTDADLVRNISNGIEGTDMPSLFYSPDRILQIVAYIRSLSAGSTPPPGDAAKGAALFRSQGCFSCHRVNGEGGRLGPELTVIGQSRSPEYLRRALVDPNADVPRRYWVLSFQDDSGKAHEGFILNEDTYTVEMIDLQGELHTFMKSGLKDYRIDKVSKMPSFHALPSADLDNLVAYLSSLRPRGDTR